MRLQHQTKREQTSSLAAEILDTASKRINLITWYNSDRCQCLECGAILNTLTHAHAAKHGYPDKFALVAAGKVKYLEEKMAHYRARTTAIK